MERLLRRLGYLLRFLLISPAERRYVRLLRQSGLFDRAFYLGVNPALHPLFRRWPERHYVVFGEPAGLQPNPEFSPRAYVALNPDLMGDAARRPMLHFIEAGRHEARITRELPAAELGRAVAAPVVRRRGPPAAEVAVVVHVYYHDLWDEIAARLASVPLPFDLVVTLTDLGAATDRLAARLAAEWPAALVVRMPNHGRDIFPFVHLVNAGVLEGYRAVCKLHTKRSPHRADGDHWRRHLMAGLLPGAPTADLLAAFLADRDAAFWVADGQRYDAPSWWGSNREGVAALLARVEIDPEPFPLIFPAGSMYWVKPLMLDMIRGMRLTQGDFAPEHGQVDGTPAHAFERALGFLAQAAGMAIRQTSELAAPRPAPARPARPSLVSAFYLPQFHPIPENDAWWGKGFTEWTAVARARPAFPGHAQPVLPADLGFYDLRLPEAMAAQAALAAAAGVGAFCVYHYWFDGRRLLQAPLDGLLARPDIAFPFCLCWANESWRRSWDGLSGEVLMAQSYAAGFEAAFARDAMPYLADPRYLRPDGRRPRLLIYRPEDMPDPPANLARLRAAFRDLGAGEVELGGVRFHLPGAHPLAPEALDFWVEMPPHGLVGDDDYLYGGPQGNRLGFRVDPLFRGLIYGYEAVIRRSLAPDPQRPANLIAGVMPSWDNSARRGMAAHLAWGANPAAFRRWLDGIARHRLPGSYRGELFVNAWNEWAEKAMLEPSDQYGRAWLDVLAEAVR